MSKTNATGGKGEKVTSQSEDNGRFIQKPTEPLASPGVCFVRPCDAIWEGNNECMKINQTKDSRCQQVYLFRFQVDLSFHSFRDSTLLSIFEFRSNKLFVL